jgi:catalase
MNDKKAPPDENEKECGFLTTNQGVKISDNQNSLRIGPRGPTLIEDFIFREKMTHFDHERIPERIVHARGSAAHGWFQPYASMAKYTRAKFLQDPSTKTPVFVRFSTVAGSRGSADAVRDVRGFAVKFYTEEGNYDLVGNNIPVFFIQDAMKFPDLVHAVKPEPHNEIPQAASAHDTFWDFVSLMPESMHMLMWLMSDRAIPRSFRMMQGFGVHTFRWINDQGVSHLVKYHFKPKLGTHQLVWDEALKINGKDPDFHRRDLWDAIEAGMPVEYELGVQIIPEGDEDKLGFDVLDATKIIPEELVPVTPVGKLVLDRNPDNFFAETEQAAFHPGHIVPGIDFTSDPLLQGRIFSYLDTQLIRLGGPNFHEIPINRPQVPISNNQRDGFMRQSKQPGRVAYEPNSLGGGCPFQATWAQGGFVSYPEKPADAHKIRVRSATFADHYSQATLFWRSMTDVEKDHIVDAFTFELQKVETPHVRERMVELLSKVDTQLASRVGAALGISVPPGPPQVPDLGIDKSPALSMLSTTKLPEGRKIAFLVGDGVDAAALADMRAALQAAGVTVKLVGPALPVVKDSGGNEHKLDHTFATTDAVLFDGIYIPGGAHAQVLAGEAKIKHFVLEAYKHAKPIGAQGDGVDVLTAAGAHQPTAVALSHPQPVHGVVASKTDPANTLAPDFLTAIAEARHWFRPGMKDIVT